MERSEFTRTAPGELLPMAGVWAFVPHELPPAVTVTPSLLAALDAARGALGEFIGQARLVQNIELVMHPFSRREAVLSSRIEGTQTAVRDILFSEAGLAADPAADRDLPEVLNYLTTLRYGEQWIVDGRPMNQFFVRALHEALLRGTRGDTKNPGSLRVKEVSIGNQADGFERARFVPPPPEHVPPLMDNIIAFMGEPTVYGSLIDAAIMHHQFETVHPFEDGNGRIGRLLIVLFLLQRQTIDRPIL